MTDGFQMNTTTVILLVVGAIVLLPFLAGGGMMGGIGMLGGLMFLWPILLIGLILVLVSGLGNRSEPRDRDAALTILRERYARGELSEEEFEERRRLLRSKD
jgi:putative membrane protein